MPALTAERSARAGGVILVIRFATGAVLNYAFGVALTWLILPSEFGAVAAAQNVLLLSTGVLTAGFPWMLALRLAENPSPEEARGQFRTAVIGNVVIGAVLATLFVVLQLGGVRLIATDSTAVVATVAAEIVVLSFNAVLNGALQGTRRFGGLGAMQSVEIIVKCAVAIALVVGLGAGTAGVTTGFLAGSAVATVIALRALRGVLPGFGAPGSLRTAGAAVPFWIATAGFTVLLTADVLGLSVVGAATGVSAAAVAAYQACSILARAGYFVADALVDAVFPFMAAHRTSRWDSHRWLLAAARWVPLVVVPLLAVMALVPGPLLALFFPAGYGDDSLVLRLLALGTIGIIVTNTMVKGLFALDRARLAAVVIPVAVLVELVALAVLVPRYGPAGAAGAALAGGWTGAVGLTAGYWRVQRPGGVPVRFLGRWAVALIPTIALLLVAAAVPLLAAWPLIVVAGVVYLALALRLGLVADEYVEKARVPSWLRAAERPAPVSTSEPVAAGRHRPGSTP
ncbi:hypothetical protein ACXR2U_12260 [Jatrophihabitans sp. YIM 134969]